MVKVWEMKTSRVGKDISSVFVLKIISFMFGLTNTVMKLCVPASAPVPLHNSPAGLPVCSCCSCCIAAHAAWSLPSFVTAARAVSCNASATSGRQLQLLGCAACRPQPLLQLQPPAETYCCTPGWGLCCPANCSLRGLCCQHRRPQLWALSLGLRWPPVLQKMTKMA